MNTFNVLVVLKGARPLSFQVAKFSDMAKEITRMSHDPFWGLHESNPVYFSEAGHGELRECTVGELIRETV